MACKDAVLLVLCRVRFCFCWGGLRVTVRQVEPDGRVLGSKIKRDDWTYEQDMVFEHAMAEFEETVSSV